MGANQSSGDNRGGGREEDLVEFRTCYYELLGVARQASDDEIKKGYRSKALKLHPDRNYGDVEATTKLFADVQAAYEVLSDAKERAWYDSHRDVLLAKQGGPSEGRFEHSVRVTTAKEILAMFLNFNGHLDFSDTPSGFYGTLRDLFEKLSQEESMACEWEGVHFNGYPSFGSADNSYHDGVRTFYTVWGCFATHKKFSWKDEYRYSEAPDRRTRRIMEKENKRIRDEGIREFNEAVRALVGFVKRRDPRFTPDRQNEAQRQQILRDKATVQAAKAKAAHHAKFSEAISDWASFQPSGEKSDDEGGEEEPLEVFECVVCEKTFKSENQYEVHEKSKKHRKTVMQLQRDMQAEDTALGLNFAASGNETPLRNPDRMKYDSNSNTDSLEPPRIGIFDDEATVAGKEEVPNYSLIHKAASDPIIFPEIDDEYASRTDVEARLLGTDPEVPIHALTYELFEEDESVNEYRRAKAKEKRAKKAAQMAQATTDSRLGLELTKSMQFKCSACQVSFLSRTRLFIHIRDLGHARPIFKQSQYYEG